MKHLKRSLKRSLRVKGVVLLYVMRMILSFIHTPFSSVLRLMAQSIVICIFLSIGIDSLVRVWRHNKLKEIYTTRSYIIMSLSAIMCYTVFLYVISKFDLLDFAMLLNFICIPAVLYVRRLEQGGH